MSNKGILLAGGRGTRLFPQTLCLNKHLIPIYDKPMIYYPLSTLILGGLDEILVIGGPQDVPVFQQLLGDGQRFGISLSYAVQTEPRGIAEALVIAEGFLAGAGSTLILGDNVFWGYLDFFREALARAEGATVFAYPVNDPERYGVVEFDDAGRAVSLEEKPAKPRSRYAVPGLYVYDGEAPRLARALKPSPRGELEITDLNRAYLNAGRLNVVPLGRGMAWLDTGTPQSLLEASEFVSAVERRQGLKIGCPEEAALRKGLFGKDDLARIVQTYPNSEYRSYLEGLLNE